MGYGFLHIPLIRNTPYGGATHLRATFSVSLTITAAPNWVNIRYSSKKSTNTKIIMKIFDFEQFVIAWWQDFLSSHSIKSTILADANNGDAIYEALFNNPPVALPSELREIPSKREFLKNFLSQFKTRYSVSGCRDGEFYNEIKECSYGELFIEKMAEDAAEYEPTELHQRIKL